MRTAGVLLSFILAFVVLAVMHPAQAQESDALRFFQHNPGSTRLLFRQTPPRPQAPAPRLRSIPNNSFVARPRTVPAPLPETPAIPPAYFVHVVGDSLSEALANGLRDHLLTEKPDVAVLRKSRSSSGLVRDDYHNWPQALREMLASQEKVDLVIMMLGSNERQQLRDEQGSHEFRSDRWRELYVRRVDEVITAVQEKRVPLLWVGMPIMQSQRLSADMIYLNEIYRERTARAGVTFVDIWEAFVDDQNQFNASGPDVNGQIVRLRTVDGVHFTRAGSLKLGFFTGKEALRAISDVAPAATALAALPQELSEQIRRDTPGLAPQVLQGVVPLPEELPQIPVIRERPLQGPVIELTAAPTSSGAILLNRRLVAPSNEMAILVEQALAYGVLLPPKPGRADDHRWPGERPLN